MISNAALCASLPVGGRVRCPPPRGRRVVARDAARAGADTACVCGLRRTHAAPPSSRLQVARGRAIIPANRRHLELEPCVIGEDGRALAAGEVAPAVA